MKHAIILFIHHLPEQVNIFIDQILKSTDMDIYIHINAKYYDLKDKLIKDNRVFISDSCFPITWGGDGLTHAIIQMFKEVINSGKEYGHVLLCSGQDLIIKRGLEEFLDNNTDKVYLDSHESDRVRRIYLLHEYPKCFLQLLDSKWDIRKILRSLYMKLLYRGVNLFPKRITYDVRSITFYYSPFWGALPFPVIKHVVDITSNESFMTIYNGSFMTEESFLATIVMNSPYSSMLHFDENGLSHSLTYILGSVNGHPPVITMNDISKLSDSGAFFARKFDARIDNEVIKYYRNLIG